MKSKKIYLPNIFQQDSKFIIKKNIIYLISNLNEKFKSNFYNVLFFAKKKTKKFKNFKKNENNQQLLQS